MASLLAQQLTRLNAQRGFDGHNKATLLHDAKAAGHFTAEDAFRVGLEGFEELCAMDKRFERFRATLFASVPPEREKQTRDEIELATNALEEFLKLLTDYFTEPCGMKTLEHLVRNFRVHVYNVDACMGCGLVYHSTAEFQKLLSILNLTNSRWHWMCDLQKAQLPFPRDLLIQRCLSDTGMLHFACEMAKWSSDEKFRNSRILSFYAVLICEVLEKADQVSEEMMRCLMSVIAAGLRISASQDFHQATHIVIVQLCTKASLSEKALSALVQSLLEWRSMKEIAQLMAIVCHIFNTQLHFSHLSEKHLKLLYTMQDCSQVLGDLMRQGLNAKRFLGVLLKKLVKRVAADPGSPAVGLLEGLIVNAPLEPHVVEMVISLFALTTAESLEASQQLIRAVDVHYPVLLDQAVNTFLKSEKEEEKRQRVLTLLHGVPSGFLHGALEGSDLTLLSAADAPESETRRAALEQLRSVGDLHERPEMAAFVAGILLRRLGDETFEVASAAVMHDLSVIQDAASLYSALIQLLKAAMERLHKEDDLAEKTALRCLECLLERAGTQFSPWSEDLCMQLMDYLFPFSRYQISVSAQIGKGMGSVPYPLAQALSAELQNLSSSDLTVDAFHELLVGQLTELLNRGDDLLSLFQRGNRRVCSFLCAAIEQRAKQPTSEFNKATTLHCLTDQLRQLAEESHVHLKIGHTVNYGKILLSALTALLQSLDPADASGMLDLNTGHELLSLILIQTEQECTKCAVALLNLLGRGSQVSCLLHFLTLPRHDHHPELICKGLTLCRGTLLKEIEAEDTVRSVNALCVLLSHSAASVRKASLKLMHKWISHFPEQASPLLTAIRTLFQYLRERAAGIKADPQSCVKVLSEFLRPSKDEGHRSKKQKTLKERASNSGAATELHQHFLTELETHFLLSHSRPLKLLFAVLKSSTHDDDLLLASLPILEAAAGATPLSLDAEEAGEAAMKLFHTGTLSKLFKKERAAAALECFSKCLHPTTAGKIKKAALEVMSSKWMRTVESRNEVDILPHVLKCAHTDPDPEISNLAASRAAMWPLQSAQVEAALQLTPEGAEQCLWMLELLQSREDLTAQADLNLFHLTQDLLYQIWIQHRDEEIPDDTTSQICRTGFGVLQKLIELGDPGALNMEMVVGYLQWSSDPVLKESIMSVLQSTSAKAPLTAMNQILKVLCQMGQSSGHVIIPLQQRQVLDAVTAIVKSWTSSREQILEVWNVILSILGTLPEQQGHSVLQATLMGMTDRATEALSLALLHLLSHDDPEKSHLSHQLCQLATLSERHGALALVIREIRQDLSTALERPLLQRALDLTLSILKGSSFGTGMLMGSTLSSSSAVGCSIGLDQILMEAVLMLHGLNQHDSQQATNIKSAKKQLQSVLSILNASMDPNSYLLILGRMLPQSEADLTLTLLEMMRKKLHDLMQMEEMGWMLSVDLCEICPHLLKLSMSTATEGALLFQLILAVIQLLVHFFGTQQPGSFLEWIPRVAEFSKHANPDIRGSALTCMAALLRDLKDASLEYLPMVMPAILESMEITTAELCRIGYGVGNDRMEEDTNEGLDFISGLALIEALLEGMGAFLSPYLSQLLKIIFQPNVSEDAMATPLLTSILALLPKQVPSRLLLPELVSCYTRLSGNPSPDALCPFLAVFKGLISTFSPTMAEQYLPQVHATVALEEISQDLEGLSVSDQLSVEAAALEAFQCFVMKLSEKQFKPLLDALLDWMFSEPGVVGHHVTGFHLLSELTEKLKALFVGYVPAFLDTALELCSAEVGKKPWSDAHADLSHQHLYLRRAFILQTLLRALIHDEEDILHQQSMEKILAIVIPLLRKSHPPSQQFIKDITLSADPHLRFKGSEICRRDPLSGSLVALLIHLGKQSSLQKSVNHQVLKCCVKGGSYSRVLALCTVREIVSHSKEEFTPLIPETLPRIAELVEDSESILCGIAHEILSLFEEITGESLEQHIQQRHP